MWNIRPLSSPFPSLSKRRAFSLFDTNDSTRKTSLFINRRTGYVNHSFFFVLISQFWKAAFEHFASSKVA